MLDYRVSISDCFRHVHGWRAELWERMKILSQKGGTPRKKNLNADKLYWSGPIALHGYFFMGMLNIPLHDITPNAGWVIIFTTLPSVFGGD